MPYDISFTDDCTLLTIEGEFNTRDVEEVLSDAVETHKEASSSLLIDVRLVTNTATKREIHEFINIYKYLPFKRIAIVVSSAAHFGMARMFSTYSDVYNKQEVSVFYGVEEAKAWLSESWLFRSD